MSLNGKSVYYLNWNFINQELPTLVNKVNKNFQVKTDGESESTYLMLSIISASFRLQF